MFLFWYFCVLFKSQKDLLVEILKWFKHSTYVLAASITATANLETIGTYYTYILHLQMWL